MKLNGKTLLVGLLLGFGVAMLMAAAGDPSTVGQYQISSSGTYLWVIDTETGQVWSTEKRLDDSKPNWIVAEPIRWFDYGYPMKGQGR